MRTLRVSLVGAAILALLGGLGGAIMAQNETAGGTAFPTGTFVAEENSDLVLEFHEDGTGRHRSIATRVAVHFDYAADGELYTELAHDWASAPQVPATYGWDFDGQHLLMELRGEDPFGWRNRTYADHTWRHVPEPREALLAYADLAPGDRVVTDRAIVPTAEADPDAFTFASQLDIYRSVATVPIAKGQIITPEMLQPLPPD